MSGPIIIDAGPALNFFATNQERLLLSVIGGYLSAPETVAAEVLRKSSRDPRFRGAENVWRKLVGAKRLEILPDDVTPALQSAAALVVSQPLARRQRQARDLGEVMVIVHGVRLATEGQDVALIIDDGHGAQLASRQVESLAALRDRGQPVGRMSLFNTPLLLEGAARSGLVASRGDMKRVYERLRECDDGLEPFERTKLAQPHLWRP